MKQIAKLFGPPEDQFLVTRENDPFDGKPIVRYQRPSADGCGTISYAVQCSDWQRADELFARVDEAKARAAFDYLSTQAGALDELEKHHG